MSNQEKITRRLATLDLGYNPDEKDLFDDETKAEIEGHLEHLKNGGAMYQDVHDCFEHAVHHHGDGVLGDYYDCGKCGEFVQAG